MKILRLFLIFISFLTIGNLSAQWTDDNSQVSGSGIDVTIATFLNNGYAVSCFGGSNGEIRATINTGTGPYYYEWSNGEGGQGPLFNTITNLSAGTFQVTVYDLGNDLGGGLYDEVTLTVSISSPPELRFKTSGFGVSQTNPTCSYLTDGSISSKATGGIGGYSYSWDDIPSTLSRVITNIGHGTHTVTVQDGNLCSAQRIYVVDQPTDVFPNVVVTTQGCGAGNDGVLTSNPSGGSGVYSSYSWVDGAGNNVGNTNVASSLSPGNYTLTVIDNAGCTFDTTAILNAPTAITYSTSETQTNCATSNDGASTITVSGGLAPYDISWTGPTNGLQNDAINVSGQSYQITGLASGNYDVTITDASGCNELESFSITSPVALSQTNSITDVTCSGDVDGAIDFTVTGGSAPYDISWAGPTNGSQNDAINISGGSYQITGLVGGNYDVTITDDNGCILSSNSNTINEPLVLDETTTTSDVSCSGGTNGSINIVVTGGTAPYDISWTGTANGSQNDAINVDGGNYSITTLSDGNYAVTITDDNSCQIVVNNTIFDPQPLTIAISSKTDVSCNGLADGTATATVPSGSGTLPYEYTWSNLQSTTNSTDLTNLATNLSAGPISVTIEDGNGCTATANETITEPTAISASMGVPTMVLCNGGSDGSVTVTGSGGTVAGDYNYQWSNGQSLAAATGLVAGSYTVIVKDDNNCQTTAGPVTITEPTAISASMGVPTMVLCNGGSDGSVTVTGSGGTVAGDYNYQWSNGQSLAAATGLVAGSYTVIVKDDNNCQTTAGPVTITEPTAISASMGVPTMVLCNGGSDGSVTVTGSGGTVAGDYNYQWSNGQSLAAATGLVAGSYTVIVKDDNNCQTTAGPVTITEPTAISASMGVPTMVLCNGGSDGSVTVTGSGGTVAGDYNYQWSNGQSLAAATGLVAGSYTVIVKDDNNCQTTAGPVTITEPTAISASMGVPTMVLCNGGSDGSVTVTGSGGTVAGDYNYQWSNGQSLAAATGLVAGSYTVIVKDDNNCQTTAGPVTITEPNVLSQTNSTNDVSCNGGSDGAINIVVFGGTSPYDISWTGSANGSQNDAINVDGGNYSISSLVAGNYVITITDDNNCSINFNQTIFDPQPLTIAISSKTDISCNGLVDGTATASVPPGSGTFPYAYTWSNLQSTTNTTDLTNLVTNLSAGPISVTIEDGNGCTATANETILEPTPVSAIMGVPTMVSCNGGSDGSVTVTASGGTVAGDYNYLWSNGQSLAAATGLAAGSYTVTVTDDNDCKVENVPVTITEPTILTATISSFTDPSCFGFSDGNVTVTVDGGTPDYSYSWTGGLDPTLPTASSLSAGTYTVTVTDDNGCVETASQVLTNPSELSATIDAFSDISCFGAGDGTITILANGGNIPYNVSWDGDTISGTVGYWPMDETSGTNAGDYSGNNQNATLNNGVSINQSGQYGTSFSFDGVDDNIYVLSSNLINLMTVNNRSYSLNFKTNDVNTRQIIYEEGAHINGFNFYILNGKLYAGAYSESNGFQGNWLSHPISINTWYSVVFVFSNSGDMELYVDGNSVASSTGATAIANHSGSIGIGGMIGASKFHDIGDDLGDGNYFNGSIDDLGIWNRALAPAEAAQLNSRSVINNNSPAGDEINSDGGSYTITPLGPGDYTITVTDANGCSFVLNQTIIEPAVLAETHTDVAVTCNGQIDGSSDVTVTGGTAPYNINWNGAASSNPAGDEITVDGGSYTMSNLIAGTYNLTIADLNNCIVNTTVTITEPDVLAIGSMSMDSASCNGVADGTATANGITGGNGINSFSWNTTPIQTMIPATGLAAGDYTVTVTDQKGCNTSDSVTVLEPLLLVIDTTYQDSVSCNGLSDGSASVLGAGGNGIYSYLWSDGQTTSTASNLTAGTFNVTVTDQKGCFKDTSVMVLEPEPLDANLLDTDSVICNSGSDGSVTIDASGGTAGYDVSWTGVTASGTIYSDNPVGIEITNEGDSFTVNTFPSGTYDITVTDRNGCITNINSIPIYEPDVMSISTISHPVIADFQYMGINPDKNTFCYYHAGKLSWNAGRAKCQANGGDYIVVSSLSDQITYNSLLGSLSSSRGWIGLFQNTSSPNYSEPKGGWEWIDGTTLDYDAATDTWSGYQEWGGGEPNDAGTENFAQFFNQPNPGEFNWNDHRTTFGFYMEIPIGNIINGNNVSCFGGNDGKVAVTAVGGETPYSYSWNTTPAQTTDTAFNLIAGQYIVIVTDALGCEARDTVIITEPIPYDISFSQDSVNCFNGNDGSASVVVSGGTPNYTYLWDDTTAQTTATATNLSAGTYNVLISDDKSCDSIVTIEVLEPVIYDITTSQDSITCNGDSDGWAEAIVNSGGTGTYTYLWDAAAGNQTTSRAINLSAGTYSVTISDSYSCDTVINVEVLQPDPLSANSNPTHVTCFGGNDGELLITATGGSNSYNLSWAGTASGDPIGFEILPEGGNYAISNLVAGPYQVILTDQNLCSNTIFPTIFQPDQLIVYTSFDSVSCNGLFDGAAFIDSSTGGSIPYTYLWNTGETNDTAVNLTAGTYNVTITDQKGCFKDTSVTVLEPLLLVIDTIFQDSVSCNGLFDGSASVAVSGGNGIYSYLWSDGQPTSTASNLTAGTYNVTITDQKGCFKDTSVTVLEPLLLVIDTIFQDSVSCNGLFDGSASVAVSGGNEIYSYLWSDGQTTSTASNLTAGTYSVTITDQKGCFKDTSVTVLEPALVSVDTSFQDSVSCNGLFDGSASILGAGGNGIYSYLWSDGQTTSTASNLTAGTYNVTITDQKGCFKDTSVTVLEPALVSVDTSFQDSVSCNGLFDGSASILGAGGNGIYSYLWSDGQPTSTASNLTAGTYNVTITDQKGCFKDTSVTVLEPALVSVDTSFQDSVSCNGLFDGSASILGAGGNGIYSYLWSDGQTTSTASNLTAGTYNVTITDQKGCFKDTSVTVLEPALVSVDTSFQDSVSCNGLFDGSASVAVSGGNGIYSYLWSDGQTTSTASNLTAGTYNVTITDQKGCFKDTSVTVLEPLLLVIDTIFQDSVSCNGLFDGSASVAVSGGNEIYSYLWSDGQPTSTASNLTAGTYSVTITDQKGCFKDTSVTVLEPALVSVDTSFQDSVSCNGLFDGSASILGAGGNGIYSYLWSDGQPTSTASNLTAGTYNVTITDQKGCFKDTSVTVLEPALVSVDTSFQDSVSCNGLFDGSASILGAGGNGIYSYLWSDGQPTSTASNLTAGTYNVTITDQKGCFKDTSVTVLEPLLLVIDTIFQDSVSCNGLFDGSASVAVSGGNEIYSYLWSDGQPTSTASNLTAGTYSVTITDQKGCFKDTSVTVLEPLLLVIDTIFQDSVSCNGLFDGSASVAVSGGNEIYSYLWSDGQPTSTASNLTAGTYSVTITDQKGCFKDTSVTVLEPLLLVIDTIFQDSVSCNGLFDGSASVAVSGGNGIYSYLWSDGQTTSTASNLTAGTYNVTITDQKGCFKDTSVTVLEPALVSVDTSFQDSVSCNGLFDGSASILGAGGNGIYSYLWSDGQPTSTASNLTAGTYNVTITDQKGCFKDTSVTVLEPALVSVDTSFQDSVSCNGLFDGSASVAVSGGNEIYSYLWSDGQPTSTASNLTAGTYSVTITDQKGCFKDTSVTVLEPLLLVIDTIFQDSVSCNGLFDGSASVAVSGGNGIYSYLWSDGQPTSTASNLTAGTYSVTITDQKGCFKDTSVTVFQNDALVIGFAGQDSVSCYGLSDGLAVIGNFSGGLPPYNLQWDLSAGGVNTDTAFNLTAGSYTATITDFNLCTLDTTIVVLQPNAVTIDSISQDSVSCNGLADGTAFVGNISGGTGSGYNYSWTDALGNNLSQDSSTAINLLAGIYNVVVTDNFRFCTNDTLVEVFQPIGISLTSNVDSANCGNSDGNAFVFASGGSVLIPNGYFYSWEDDSGLNLSNNNNSLLGVSSSTYTVFVTDDNLCTDSLDIVVPEVGGPIVTDSIVDIRCFGDTTGAIYITVNGISPISYSWNGPAGFISPGDTPNALNLDTGLYSITVTDGNTCNTIVDSLRISEPVSALSIDTVVKDLTCFSDLSGSIEISVNNGTAPYNYSWSGENGFNSSTQNISNLNAGVYVLNVIDSNNCKIINDSISVQQPDSISILETLISPTCNSLDGSINVTVLGGTITTDYIYNWDNLTTGTLAVGTNASLTGIGAGTYQITITDDSFCTNNKIIPISNENSLTVTDSTINITCKDDTDGEIYLSISGLSGTTYGVDWDIDGLIDSGDPDGPDNNTLTNLSAGIYVAYITDSANGCVTIHSDTVFDPGAIFITSSFDSVSCNGLLDGSASVVATGANGNYTYLWDALAANQTTDTAYNLGAGNYSVTVTDVKGCFNDTTVTVEEPITLSIVSTGQDSVSCFGANDGKAYAEVTGGTAPFSPQWDFFAGAQTTDTAFNLLANTYRVVITDFNGCKDSTDVTVFEPPLLVIGSMSMDSITCNGASDGTATANSITGGNGINTYSWNTTPIQTTNPATGLSAGNYTVTVTDQNGCTATRDTTVLEPDQIVVDTIAQDSVSCFGVNDGSAYVGATGGTGFISYLWDASAANQTIDTAIALAAGFYTVRLTDENGCFVDTNATVFEPNLLVVDTTAQDSVSCSAANNGSAYVAVSGGNGTYTFLWSDGQDTDTASNLIAGTYQVTIFDQMLCSVDTSITVLEPTPLLVDTTSQDSVLCNGSTNGSAYVAVSGGNGSYTYLWSDGQTTDTASNIAAGTYQVTITDQLFCSIDTSVTVMEPDTFVVDTSSVINPYCSSSNDASINLNVSGGTSPYSFNWSDMSGTFSSTNQDINSLFAGTYYVLVTDTNGCTANDTVILLPGLEIIANAGPEDTLVCFGDSLSLTGISSGANNPSISWNLLGTGVSSNSTLNYTFNDSATTIYDFVFVVSEQTCTVQDSIKVTVAPLPIVDAGSDAVINPGSPFTLGGSPTGPVNSSYIWTPLSNFYYEEDSINENPEIEVNSSEIYVVFVTDSNGCLNSDTIKVDIIPDLVVPSAFSPNNDGINDSWIIEIPQQYTNVSVRVYNRWGSLVYDRASSGGDNWTGNGNNSNPIPVGTYYFVIEYDGLDGQKENVTGPITIIR